MKRNPQKKGYLLARRTAALVVVLAAAALFVACEQVFTYSPMSFLQRDPSDLPMDQKISYAQLALEGGDAETQAKAYEAIKDNPDPDVQLLASKVAIGASGINEAAAEAVDAMQGDETVDTDALMNQIDDTMLQNAIDAMAAADADSSTKKDITSEDYLTTAAAAVLLEVKSGTDITTIDLSTETADKTGTNLQQAAYYLQESGYSTDDMNEIEEILGG